MYIGHSRRVSRCGFMPQRISLGHAKISQRSTPQSLYTHLSSFISLVLPLLVPPLLLAPISLVVPSFFCYLRSAMCQARLPGLPVGHRRDSPLSWFIHLVFSCRLHQSALAGLPGWAPSLPVGRGSPLKFPTQTHLPSCWQMLSDAFLAPLPLGFRPCSIPGPPSPLFAI